MADMADYSLSREETDKNFGILSGLSQMLYMGYEPAVKLKTKMGWLLNNLMTFEKEEHF
jgi:hypothetical protein